MLAFLMVSLSLNIYFIFFNPASKDTKSPAHKRLTALYDADIRVGDVYSNKEEWDYALAHYKNAIKNLPVEFTGHERLLFVLTQKCKEKDIESCVEARNYIGDIRSIFQEKQKKLTEILSKINQYQ